MQSINLGIIDISIIVAYFFVVFLVALWPYKKGDKNSDDYFLAGRNLGWFVIGASLFASNIGSEHLIGLAGTGAKSGVAVANFELLASFILLLLGWFFAPFYLKSRVTTMPEFLEFRYSPSARYYLSIVSVFSYVITKISATIFAGAIIFECLGVDFWTGAFLVVSITGLYTVIGGLRAVIYTDTIQVFIMIFGSIAVSLIGIQELGGLSQLKSSVDPEFFNFWKPMSDPSFPWTGILFGAPILGVWYWCTDQFIVQRVLSARNLEQARKGTLFAGFLKVLPLFIFVFPGLIATALVQKGAFQMGTHDQALPSLIAYILPTGFKGLVLASLLSALMSSLSSVFNSCSTLITYDFYKAIRPKASDKELVRMGQIITGVLVILGLLWIPLMKKISGNLFTYIQSVQAYVSPPIASVFLLGLFFKRLNAKGAILSLYSGLFLGLARLVCEIFKEKLSGVLLGFASINFLHFALYLFIFCSIMLVLGSLLSGGQDIKQENVKRIDEAREVAVRNLKEFKMENILALGLILFILILWYLFSPLGYGA
jgi:SSS family solute:Na+ symporter